jgi:hypothetical protein
MDATTTLTNSADSLLGIATSQAQHRFGLHHPALPSRENSIRFFNLLPEFLLEHPTHNRAGIDDACRYSSTDSSNLSPLSCQCPPGRSLEYDRFPNHRGRCCTNDCRHQCDKHPVLPQGLTPFCRDIYLHVIYQAFMVEPRDNHQNWWCCQ